MRSSKSRSRSKQNRQRSPLGNIVNRVFDSSGPEGKVRGTPQQIIDKYLTLARDAQLSNDRVAAENFLQHAEHYARMLSEAQREMEAMRQQQGGGEQRGGEGDDQRGEEARDDRQDRREDRREDRRDGRRDDRQDRPEQRQERREDRRDARRGDGAAQAPAGEVFDIDAEEESGLVETPEMRGAAEPVEPAGQAQSEEGQDDRRRPRRGRKPKAAAADIPPEAAE